jgi:hypothetical protein
MSWKRCWKPFYESLLSCTVAFVKPVARQKPRPLMLISVEVTGKNRLLPGQEIMWNAVVLAHCSLIKKNSWPKPAGVLEHYREGETY